VSFLLSRLPEAMTEISEVKQSPVPGRKKVFIPIIHRPGFDSCVPNHLIGDHLGIIWGLPDF
jgi:hypothetical protein